MKTILPLVWICVGSILLAYIGVKNHPEESHRMVIVKHRPSLKLEFYSPIGDSDKSFEELSPKEQEEELLYQEFIKRTSARTIDNIALLFFQLGVYLIVLSLLRMVFFRRSYRFSIGRLLSVNLIGLVVALGVYQIYWTKDLSLEIAMVIQVVLNFILIFPRLRKNAK